MKVFITYCSANKSDAKGLIPAIDRYRSSRINRVRDMAIADGRDFYIMSGVYGVIHNTCPIPWYDHLLIASEVDALTIIVADQVEAFTHITFYTTGEEIVRPYEDTIRKACETVGTTIEFKNPFEGR